MFQFFLILGFGLLGLYLHWLVRWKQGRTTSTFNEYMTANLGYSISSLMSSISASTGILYALPVEPTEKEFIIAILFSLSSSYMIDSVVNKDVPQNIAELPDVAITHKEVVTENKLVSDTIDQIRDKV